MDLRRRVGTLVVAVGVATFLGLAFADSDQDSIAPSSAPQRAAPCGAWGEIDDHPAPGIQAAANEVAARYQEHPDNDHFTGVGVCGSDQVLTVWRIPGSVGFDAEMADVAHRRGVGLRLVDSTYSAETLEETIDDIKASRANGLHLAYITYRQHDGGFVEVGVNEDVEAGRRALAEYGDKVRVEGGVFFHPT
jgi:hypothetical protein